MARRGRPPGFDRDAAADAAMRLFWRRGYEGTAVSDLTAALGVGPPSLYAAFGSKEGLFRAAVARYLAGPGGFAARAAADAPTGREAVRRVLRAAAAAYTDPADPPGCLCVLAAATCGPGSAAVGGFLAGVRRANEASLRALLECAPDLPDGAGPAVLAKFVATVLQGMSVQARDGATRGELEAVGELALRAWPPG
jgi:AcrR family transcriptional regulator